MVFWRVAFETRTSAALNECLGVMPFIGCTFFALNKRADLFDGVARATRAKYASKVGEMTSRSMVVLPQ